MSYDVLIIGGGPAGLSAALTLGRARRRVLLTDAGPRRNAAAEQVHNFVTRDGTPPDQFRAVGREQLRTYPNVEVRDAHVDRVTGTAGAFTASVGGEDVRARRVLLATGMIDEMLPIDGFRALFGKSVFQCPYCHGWEVRDRAWGYLASGAHAAHATPFTIKLRAWTPDVTLFTNGELELDDDALRLLRGAGVRVETGRVTGLVGADALEAVELAGGERVRCEVLFAHPPQRQVELVGALGLALDDDGFVTVDPMTRETSVPGVFAAGDLTTRMQAAIAVSAAGMQTAAAINMQLAMEDAEGTGVAGAA